MLTEDTTTSDDLVTEETEAPPKPRSRGRAVLIGAGAGAALGLLAMVVFGGRFALQSATATQRSDTDVRAAIEFVASSGGLYLIVVFLGAAVGMAVAGISYAVGREANAEAPRYSLRALMPLAALVGAGTAYSVVRLGLGLWADITAGVVTIPVNRMILILAAAGAITGALTGDAVDRLARPELLGLHGVAVPQSTGAMMSEMSRAVGTPIVAFLVAAIFAVALSQLLLGVAHISVNLATAIFSLAGAVVLAIAVLLAYRPWERDGSGDDSVDT